MTLNAPRLGDMAQSLTLRSHAARLKADLADRSQEVATGRAADLVRHLGGDTARLAALERDLAMTAPLRRLQAEAASRAAAMQTALESIQSRLEPLGATLRNAASAGVPAEIAAATGEARDAFGAAVAALNTSAAGRSLFAGGAVGGPAIAPAEDMLDDLRAAIGGETDAATIAGLVRDWFAPGGGFETAGYLGATEPAAAVPLGQAETVALDLRADDPTLRGVLAAAALGALAADPALDLPEATSRALFGAAAADAMAVRDPMTELRAALGTKEARIEQAGVRLQAVRAGAEMARAALVGVDEYEAATRVEALGHKLESLYAVTVRLSRLTLLEQLR
ncbi:flagellin [Rhodosalinus sp.]|uniref:flagellin n=1 Tax=Rhodosalinus sp. TaxID=2047741 RepID=UPI00397BB644